MEGGGRGGQLYSTKSSPLSQIFREKKIPAYVIKNGPQPPLSNHPLPLLWPISMHDIMANINIKSCSIIKLATIAFDETSIIGQRQRAHNFSVFDWAPHDCLITIGQHFVTTRVVHLPKRTETSLINKSTKAELITSYCSYARSAQPGLIRTRLCGPYIAVKAG